MRLSESDAPGRVLVVDDHRDARESMADVLRQAGHQVACCSSAAEALEVVARETFDCVVTDLKMPGMNGVEFIIQLDQRHYGAQVVMVTAHASVSTAVEAMRHGAFDYLEKPFDVDGLERLVSQAIRHGRLVRPLPADAAAGGTDEPPAMVGDSRPMQLLREKIAQIAPTPETVLILGESGTGKELVARAIHAASNRRHGPLVSLNCPVLSAHLMESELFGHERGAFTGADAPRDGRFELAQGGSILLDEVTEIDLGLQAKLLRVLQEKTFERVGSSRTIHADVRVLATTNRDLRAEVAAGRFREDLYYRLAVVPLCVPPLRERPEDILLLADHFLRRAAERLGRKPLTLANHAAQLLVQYPWPGNVRELENIMTRSSVLNPAATLTDDDLHRWLSLDWPPAGVAAGANNRFAPAGPGGHAAAFGVAVSPGGHAVIASEVPVGMRLEEVERKLIEATLEHFGGHRAKTAEALGIGIRTLSGKLREYGYAPREKSFSKAG